MPVLSRNIAEFYIREALEHAGVDRESATFKAARIVDRIYGVPGEDSINPRYGPLPDAPGD